MDAARVTVTGASGLIGRRLVAALRERGDEVTVLTRDPERARSRLGEVQALAWDPAAGPAPAEALEGRSAVAHLAGEPVAQRWSARARGAIRDSRVLGTRNLVAGLRACTRRPAALLSASAIGYYGSHGEEPLDEEAPPGRDFLARVCVEWEREAAAATQLGMRVVQLRTGVVLDRGGGALARMLPPFRLGLGGPIASGRQYVSWIHIADLVALLLAALCDERYLGPVNATAPQPVSSRELARSLGAALHRPALVRVPGIALRAMYGEMAQVLIRGARVVPAKALMLGFEFGHAQLHEALADVLAAS